MDEIRGASKVFDQDVVDLLRGKKLCEATMEFAICVCHVGHGENIAYNIAMHPLTTFPALLTYVLVAPTLLRLTVGILRLLAGTMQYSKGHKVLSILTFVSSIMLILGLYTQIAALVTIALIA